MKKDMAKITGKKYLSTRIYSDLHGFKVRTGDGNGDFFVILTEGRGIREPQLVLHNDTEIANLIAFLKACMDNPATPTYRIDDMLSATSI